MCNLYLSPDAAAIEAMWHLQDGTQWAGGGVYPRKTGPFVRRAREDVGYSRELVLGQWGLIPWFSKTAKLTYSTNNARSEELASKASYKTPWARGQRCIIPAITFDEPCWETGRNVWWTFRRADGRLWGLAGIWNTWTDRASGELHESYSMLTRNADDHPIMSRMHKPDPKLGPDEQDKRSVIAIEEDDVDQWLTGTAEEVEPLLRPPPMEVLLATQA